MIDLTTRDLDHLLSAVERLDDAEDITTRVIAAVEQVVPNDLIAIDRFAAADQQQYLPTHWNNNPEMLSPEVEEICSAVFEQSPADNPLIRELVFNGNGGVMKLTDFGDQSGFRETAYYNEVMRTVGFEHQMAVMIGAGPGISFSCAINRTGLDFTERERQMLALLLPYLRNALTLERERRHHEEERRWMEKALESAGIGAVAFSPEGSVLRATEQGREYLEKYFPDGVRDLQRDGLAVSGPVAPAPEFNDRTRGQIRISTSFDPASRATTLIFSEEPRLNATMLQELGLTPRQAEVLYWITEGKTYETIAELTGASRRTIEKHVENIFARLGVETRTAAASAAFALLT